MEDSGSADAINIFYCLQLTVCALISARCGTKTRRLSILFKHTSRIMMDDKHLSEFPSSMNVCKSSGTSLHLEESKDKNSREQTYSTTESDRFVSEDMIDSDSDDESSVLPPPPDTEAEVDESRVPLSDMDKDENISYSFHEIIVATESLESESKSVLSHASGACTGLSDGRPNYCNQDIANASREADRKTNINEDKHKTRTNIDQRLTHALDNIASSSINRSPDLVPLTRNYHTLRKQLRALIASIKSYKKSMEQTDAARSKVSCLYRFRSFSIAHSLQTADNQLYKSHLPWFCVISSFESIH